MTRRTGLVCLLMAIPLLAGGVPNFSGKWKLNEAQTAGGNHRGTVFVIEHKEPSFKYSASGQLNSGGTFSESYEFTTDGKPPRDASKPGMAGRWEGTALVMDFMKDGTVLMPFRFRLSPDGKQMFREGQLKSGTRIRKVYDKQ